MYVLFSRFRMEEIISPIAFNYPSFKIIDTTQYTSYGSMNLALGTCVTYDKGEEVCTKENTHTHVFEL